MPSKQLRTLQKIRDARINEEYLVEARTGRRTYFQSWKDRLTKIDNVYRGDWIINYPGEKAVRRDPAVMNMIQVGLDDLARLVAETGPAVVYEPESDSKDNEKAATVREAIADTHWAANKGDLMIPRLAMDLAGAGACFVVCSPSKTLGYPRLTRVDPRACYPDVHNGVLQDLLVTHEMPIRKAARLFPDLDLTINPAVSDTAEIIEYYSVDECVRAIMLMNISKNVVQTEIIDRWTPNIPWVPVGFAQLDTYDGDFRGMFDQIIGTLNTKDRIVQLLLEYADELIYAPFEAKGVLNPEKAPGPGTLYELDPNVPDARINRVQPAGSSPQLWALLDYLDREQRGGASYPATRQGEVSQSIASAAFVDSTMGQLTTSVRNLQRLLGGMREDVTAISMGLDVKHMDAGEPKQLIRSVQRKHNYIPGTDIGKNPHIWRPRIVYGAGAGFDRVNADVRVIQHKNSGLISGETAREQIDYLRDPAGEGDRMEREAVRNIMAQKFLAEATLDVVAEINDLMDQGKSLTEAVAEVRSKQASLAPPPQNGAPGAPPAPVNAGLERQSLDKGGVPGTAPGQPAPGSRPPLSDVMVP